MIGSSIIMNNPTILENKFTLGIRTPGFLLIKMLHSV